jgi:hypothetical protein
MIFKERVLTLNITIMTTIKTSSLRTYSRVYNYLRNKHIQCMCDLEQLEVTFFGLDREATDLLLEKLIKHFHLTSISQRTLAA